MGLIRILVLAGLALIAYSVYRKMIGSPGRGEDPNQSDERLGRLVQDPECGVWVDGKQAVRREVPGGELYFCSKECAKAHLEGDKEKPAEKASEENQEPPQ